MINIRVNVRIETVLVRACQIPSRWRLRICKRYFHDRLDTFKAVLPGDDEPNWSTILIRHLLAVKPGRENCQRMHCFVETEPFDIWKINPGGERRLHLLPIVMRFKRNVP